MINYFAACPLIRVGNVQHAEGCESLFVQHDVGLNLKSEIRSAFYEATEESNNDTTSISSIWAEKWLDIIETAGLTCASVTTVSGLGRDKQVEAFAREDRLEHAQAPSCGNRVFCHAGNKELWVCDCECVMLFSSRGVLRRGARIRICEQ